MAVYIIHPHKMIIFNQMRVDEQIALFRGHNFNGVGLQG